MRLARRCVYEQAAAALGIRGEQKPIICLPSPTTRCRLECVYRCASQIEDLKLRQTGLNGIGTQGFNEQPIVRVLDGEWRAVALNRVDRPGMQDGRGRIGSPKSQQPPGSSW